MVRLTDRRSILTAGTTVGALAIAGCSQSSDSTDTEGGGGETDGSDTSSGTDSSSGSDVMTTDGSTSGGGDSGSGGASFDLNMAVDQLPDAFESLVIEFSGFEFMDVYGSNVARERDPVQVDLVQLAADGSATDLMQTTVPAGEYDTIDYFITVTDTTMASGDGEQTFRSDEDGEVLSELTDPESFDIQSGESIMLTAQMSVQDAFDYDWQFRTGFEVNRES